MFVRWKVKRLSGDNRLSYTAVVVESRRVNGKPRQQVIRYLATIQQDAIVGSTTWDNYYRVQFWQNAQRELGGMVSAAADEGIEITRTMLDAMKVAIRVRVPEPTAEDHQQAHAFAQRMRDVNPWATG